MALFGGNKLNVAVLTDFAAGQKKKVDDLKKHAIIRSESRVLLATDFCDQPEADIEDLFGRNIYLRLVDAAYGVSKTKSLEKALVGTSQSRVVKDVEDYFNVHPQLGNAFNHFEPARWLLNNPKWLETNKPDLSLAFDRFESLFKKINEFVQN